jgi:hypothetical protein
VLSGRYLTLEPAREARRQLRHSQLSHRRRRRHRCHQRAAAGCISVVLRARAVGAALRLSEQRAVL